MRYLALFSAALMLAACQTAPSIPTPLPDATPAKPTETPLAVAIQPLEDGTSTPAVTSTPAPSPFEICSPLAEITLDELDEILSNPFQMPRPGLDDAHHGVDLAFYSRGEHAGMQGWPVQAMLPGRVAAVILDRPPYGNAVIVETSFDQIPAGLMAGLTASPQPTPVPGDIRLTCPTPSVAFDLENPALALYVLYAHLNRAPLVAPGEQVTCGQAIGEVGTSGASVNPHLHLETRWGPAAIDFASMAHYEIQASDEERANYCLWRVSGAFQMIDPMLVFERLAAEMAGD